MKEFNNLPTLRNNAEVESNIDVILSTGRAYGWITAWKVVQKLTVSDHNMI